LCIIGFKNMVKRWLKIEWNKFKFWLLEGRT
jgi:hypothetical protein